MSYASKYGRRPPEYASKSSHQEIVKDKTVRAFLRQCRLPSTAAEVQTDDCEKVLISDENQTGIRHIVAIDGGYTEVPVREEFPSARIAFFQFGALFFALDDLREMHDSEFIFPEQMAKLKNIQRLKLTLPTKGICAYGAATLTASVREALHRFFLSEPKDEPLAATLKWLLFAEYADSGLSEWSLASCPVCGRRDIPVRIAELGTDYRFACESCKCPLFLTDVFRFHEAIDDELGASGVLGYVVTLIEQIILAHLIRLVLKTRPSLMREICFIKDGPLALFGQTANIYKPMRNLMCWLKDQHDVVVVGSEKSGAFVEHADAIASRLQPGTAMLLNDEYIYRHIVPGQADPTRPYGSTTYYGGKIIYRTSAGRMYVVTLPTRSPSTNPKPEDLFNFDTALRVVSQLRCDMYDSALIPVALVNKLVSLADHPSTRIIEKFAKANINS